MDKLSGQLLATQAAIRALITLHPNAEAVTLEIERQLEELVAMSHQSRRGGELREGTARRRVLPLAKEQMATAA